jgi:anti-anti-sigma factor
MTAHSEIRLSQTAEGVVVLQLVGDHDMATAPELEAHLAVGVAEGAGVVVDLFETTFVDSTVIRTLFRCHEELEQRGKRLVLLIRTPSPLARVLEISTLSDTVPCVPIREEAVRIAAETD